MSPREKVLVGAPQSAALEMVELAFQIANSAARSDIESYCRMRHEAATPEPGWGSYWYEVETAAPDDKRNYIDPAVRFLMLSGQIEFSAGCVRFLVPPA
jgi:hypothetical protein